MRGLHEQQQQQSAVLRTSSAPGAATCTRGRGGRSRGGIRDRGRGQRVALEDDASAVTVIEEDEETPSPPHECDSDNSTVDSDEGVLRSLGKQHRTEHRAPRPPKRGSDVKATADECSVGPVSTPSLTPSASVTAGSRRAASDDVVSIVSHSVTPVRKARAEGEEEEEIAQTPAQRTSTGAPRAASMQGSRVRSRSEEDDTEGDSPQSGALNAPRRTTSDSGACFSRNPRHARATSLQHVVDAAPLLHASELVEYFTYGIQASLRHHADHLRGLWDGEAPQPARDAAFTGSRVPVNGAVVESVQPRYGNAFLAAAPADRRGAATLAIAAATSRSSSTNSGKSDTTYDSDAEGSPPTNPSRLEQRQQQCERPRKANTAASASLLDPERTSLYRGPRSADTGRGGAVTEPLSDAARRGAALPDSSWLSAGSSAPAAAARGPPHRDAEVLQGNSVAELLRAALRSAYAAEDAQRHRRRAELDLQQAQLVRGLALLQGGWSAGTSALLSVLLPASRAPSAAANSASGPSPPSMQATRTEALYPAHRGAASTAAGSRGARPPRCDVEEMYAVDGNSGEAQAGRGAEASGAPPPPRVLQVMSPSAAGRLHRPPSPFVDAVLRHLQDSVQKQQAARRREDQATRAKRLYELPVLVEDVVRYAALLCFLRRRTAATAHRNGPAGNPLGSPTSPLHPVPTLGAPAALPAAALVPFGEEGTLLYLKYPAPLLRTTSFAVETVRLFKWLRTWRKKGGLAAASAAATTSGSGHAVASARGARSSGKVQRKRARGETGTSVRTGHRQQQQQQEPRRRCRGAALSVEDVDSDSAGSSEDSGSDVEVEDADNRGATRHTSDEEPYPQRVADAVKVEDAVVGGPASAPRRHTTVDTLVQQAREAQVAQVAQVKEEKRSAFLRFFGAAAAAVNPPVKAEEGTGSNSNSTSSLKDAAAVVVLTPDDAAEEELVVKQPGASLSTRTPPPAQQPLDSTDLVLGGAAGAATAAAVASSLGSLPSSTLTELTQSVSASRAYELYRLAWRHAVKTGITPLAVAASAFAAAPGDPCEDVWAPAHATPTDRAAAVRESDSTVAEAAAAAAESSWTNGRVSRVCAALPFFKEMREEACRRALGSAANGTYYEDAYGNRLRSARLAKKEQEQREQLAARQRRQAKRKGYFHRDGADEVRGGVGGASAMLEAMLRTGAAGPASSGARAGQRRRRNRRRGDTASSRDEDEEERSDCSDGSTGSEGARSPRRRRGQPGRPRSAAAAGGRRATASPASDDSASISHSDSGTSTTAAESDSDDDAGTKDELTNIAVVSGPTGAGKTAAVYVAAQLLGFRVVEMNASVRRCSKSVEHLLAELTRSHRLSGLARPGTAGGFNVEEELARLKQQHAALVERAKAEAAATEREAESKRREARKANGISAQAVASFFGKGSRTAATKTGSGSGGNSATASRPGQASVTVVDEQQPHSAPTVAAAAPASSPSPLPSPTSAPSTDTQTLLLFEDADVLLGDESAKPFYAAIRDLAHRSKVPIVVTVSADPAPSQRYDTEPFLAPSPKRATHPHQQQTYWDLCEAAGLTTSMAALEAAQQALHGETELSSRGAAAGAGAAAGGHESSSGAASTSPAAGDGGGGAGASAQAASGSPAAFLALFSPAVHSSSSSGGGAGGGAAGAGNATAGASGSSAGAGGLVSSAAAAAAVSSSAAASLAARYTHMLLNSSLVSHFFGSQTPFTVVDALPPAALFVQLLVVGAVELDLLDAVPPSQGAGLESRGGESGASWQQELDGMARRLQVRDVGLFTELVLQLRDEVFGCGADGASTSSAGGSTTQDVGQLGAAVYCDAARRTTTDIRYWLNKLQVLLLSLRSADRGSGEQRQPRKRPRTSALDASPLHPGWSDPVRSEGGDDDGGGARDATGDTAASRHRAERLVEAEFQSRVSHASSAWDAALGRHLANVTYNELHSTRYVHWLLDDHVLYGPDILEELATLHHPTARIDYSAPPTPVASATASATAPRRGRPPSASSKKAAAAAAAAVPGVGNAHGSAEVKAGGMNAAWRSFFATPAAASTDAQTSPASQSTTPSASSPSLAGTPGDTRQQMLFGYSRPTSPASPLHFLNGAGRPGLGAGSASAPATLPARSVDWPPSITELRRQSASSGAARRPVELLLPYGAAAQYYTAAAASASGTRQLQLHAAAEPTAGLLGHDAPLLLASRPPPAGTLEAPASDFDVMDALPMQVRPSQEDRFSVFRRWWRRTRKVGALRDSVAGRSAGTLEDLVGFGALLTPSAAASVNASSGAL